MSYHFSLIGQFIRASLQEEVAYRANFAIGLLNSLLNLGSGLAGLIVIFDQVDSVRGWDFGATLAVLGIYLTVNALRDLFIGPSFNSLVGMAGDVWKGTLDFTLLRPVDMQFLTSFRRWRLFSLVDLGLGLGVLGVAVGNSRIRFDGGEFAGVRGAARRGDRGAVFRAADLHGAHVLESRFYV